MRRFSIFKSVKASKGEDCTYEKYLEVATSQELKDLCDQIAAETDKEKRAELKKKLPIITWQAAFDGKRLNREAKPSGLFMLDVDHVDDPYELYKTKIASRCKELGIVYVGKTASTKGLRIVAECRTELFTLEECQRWLASNLKIEYDGVCKDFARSSFMVHDSYTYYMNAGEIWKEYVDGTTLYNVDGPQFVQHFDNDEKDLQPATPSEQPAEPVDQREGLFGAPTEYKGVPYERIIKQWFFSTGGEPTSGERNPRLYQLALRLRYITDFNEATMLKIMPDYGLPKTEIKEIVRHALSATRASRIPQDLQDALDLIDKQIKLGADIDNEDDDELITRTDDIPKLPPVFRQWCEVSPEDFKKAVVLCQLPILGALGSRLRAEYLDGQMHSPTFQVSLEAPQASGKSFLSRLIDCELAQMKEADEKARADEREYAEKMSKLKMLNVKMKKGEAEDVPEKPHPIVRYVPATMSITKLLMRMQDAQGLHLFAFSPEIDTVLKAFKRGFSSFSDALRVSFDNGEYGQDYASDQSFSGMVRLYYNALFSGTPKAMCRFYPDVEDGLVSRVLFCTLPDQFGKPMPKWGTFTAEQQRILDIGLVRLNEISLQGDEVQPLHVMKMGWLNKELEKWLVEQQAEALRHDDRTRDIFCRRAAVVGFRAGMLGWFLWGEVNTPTVRRQVSRFALWVANCMLNQHLLRFNIQGTHSNVNQWENIYEALPQEFTREELQQALNRENVGTKAKMVIYKWKLLGTIETVAMGTGQNNKKAQVKFKKVQK